MAFGELLSPLETEIQYDPTLCQHRRISRPTVIWKSPKYVSYEFSCQNCTCFFSNLHFGVKIESTFVKKELTT